MRGVVLIVRLAALLAVAAPAAVAAQTPQMRTPADSALAGRIRSAIEAASDVPSDSVRVVAEAASGRVHVIGSVVCDDCGGNSTPGGAGTVQQSLGAIVRAVPGVQLVRFDLRYRPPDGG
jgi:hypothetical protein